MDLGEIASNYFIGSGVTLLLGFLLVIIESLDSRRDQMNANLARIGLAYNGRDVGDCETRALQEREYKRGLLAQILLLPILSWLGAAIWLYIFGITFSPRRDTAHVRAIKRLERENILDRQVIAELLIRSYRDESDCHFLGQLKAVTDGMVESVEFRELGFPKKRTVDGGSADE